MTTTTVPALTDEQQRWVAHAEAHLDPTRVLELAAAVTSIPSPTGQEAQLARFLAEVLASASVPSRVQYLDIEQANALGRLRGSGNGPDLLLYAPIDTLTTGSSDEDVPWIGAELADHMTPSGRIEGDLVTGLGASNPKGHATAVLVSICTLAAAEIPLSGDVVAGFGAGGMPTNARPKTRPNIGHGVGCSYLLEQGGWADFAVIAKPGWAVSCEEVGVAWFEVTVTGTHTYVGSRHRLPYRNPIIDAAWLVERFETWFESYTRAHTGETIAPQAIVGAIEGGWWRMAAVTPAVCRFLIDLRLAPQTSPAAAQRLVRAFLADATTERPGLEAVCELVVAIPGTRTDPESLIARAATTAWESEARESHRPATATSGATDANILRSRGIPTVRIGMPKVARHGEELDFAAGMNTVDTREIVRLSRVLIRTAVAVTTSETSLDSIDRGAAQ